MFISLYKMETKIPKQLNLICETYDIKIVSQKEMNKIDKDKDTLGLILPAKKTIYIVDDKTKEDTLWHELGHYFIQTIGAKDNEASAQLFSDFVRGIFEQLKGGNKRLKKR